MTKSTMKEMLEWFDGYGKDEYKPRCPLRSGPYNEKMRDAIRRLILASDKGPEVDEGFVADLISIFREETRYRDWDTDEQRFQAIKSRVCRAFGKAGSKVKEAAHD